MKFLTATILTFSANLSLAGGWSGTGGGEILEDHSNPWFLTNKATQKTITYCIHLTDDFPHTSEVLDEQIRGAVAFWRESFVTAHSPEINMADGKSIRVGVQTGEFVRRNCSLANAGVDGKQEVDIVFQFGILNEFQKQEFKKLSTDLTRFVALTIRSEYDPVMMRGKGFIYVSPDRGDMAMKGQNLIDKVWGSSCKGTINGNCGANRLGDALRHELGHVFGMQHSSLKSDLMGASFLEQVVTSEWYGPTTHNVFFPNSMNKEINLKYVQSKYREKFLQFFDIDSKSTDVKIKFSLDQVTVEEKKDTDLPWTKAGNAKFDNDFNRKFVDAVRVWLPPAQKIFQVDQKFSKSILGPQVVSLQNAAQYRSLKSNVIRPMMVQAHISSIQMMGTMDVELIADLLALVNNFESGWVVVN